MKLVLSLLAAAGLSLPVCAQTLSVSVSPSGSNVAALHWELDHPLYGPPPVPPITVGVYDPVCAFGPFQGGVQSTCDPLGTTTTSPASTVFVASWNFNVLIGGKTINTFVESVTSEFTSHCGPSFGPIYVTWSTSKTTTQVNGLTVLGFEVKGTAFNSAGAPILVSVVEKFYNFSHYYTIPASGFVPCPSN